MNSKYEGIILIVDNRDLPFVLNLREKLAAASGNKKYLILTKNAVNIKDNRYPVVNIAYYQKFLQSSYSDIIKDAHELFHSLAEKKICDSSSIKELSMYKGVSLWELSAQRAVSEFLPVLHDFNIAEVVLEHEKPSEVHVVANLSSLEKTFESICYKRGIRFRAHKKAGKGSPRIRGFFKNGIIFAKKSKRFLVKFKFLLSNIVKDVRLGKSYEVIFFAPPEERLFLSMLPVALQYNAGKRMVINAFLSECSGVMKKNNIFYMDFYGHEPCSLFARYPRRLLKNIKHAISGNESFYSDIAYKGTCIGDTIKRILQKLIDDTFPDNINRIDIIRKIISRYAPKVIVVINSPPDIVLTAKSLSVPIIAMQSGFVTELCRFGPLIVDAVTVDGSYWREYLLKTRDFDSNKVYITGPSRLDVMLTHGQDSDTALNFSKSKKTVVFFSIYTDLDITMGKDEKIKHIKNVCNAMRNIKEARLIIKLHPCETDFKLYKDMAENMNLKDVSIVKDIDIRDLLRMCDLVITSFSTAGYEAVLFDKNVISLTSDYFCQEDAWHFKEYGATISVSDFEKLENHIRDVLFDRETIDRLKLNREKYIYEHAYKIDGKASERVKKVIDQFIYMENHEIQ